MGDSSHLDNILDLCIQIDQSAVELYTSLAAAASSKALKSFWTKIASEGQSHLEYWQQLKTLNAYDELPQPFDTPERVLAELVEREQQIGALREQWEKDKSAGSAFVTAYRLESYKLHPAFRTLYQYYRPVTQGTIPEGQELDETNINAFVAALQKYGAVTPELELVGETLQRLWDQNKALSQQAMIDPLSEILNRRGFFMMAQQMAYLSKRNRIPIAVLLVEIDNFKRINEIHNPQTGDEVIKITASKLKSGLRQSDLIARYGGDEFIILLPDTTEEGGVAVGKKLRKVVNKARPMGIAVTVGIGVAENTMKEDIDLEFSMLVRRAEENLIVAKTNGANQIVF